MDATDGRGVAAGEVGGDWVGVGFLTDVSYFSPPLCTCWTCRCGSEPRRPRRSKGMIITGLSGTGGWLIGPALCDLGMEGGEGCMFAFLEPNSSPPYAKAAKADPGPCRGRGH